MEVKDPPGSGRSVSLAAVCIFLALIPFYYGKYFEFKTDGPFDGSLNVYGAKSILSGQRMGVDIIPSARPATLLVNIVGVGLFGFSEFGPKFIQMLMQVAAFGLMYYTIRKIYGSLAAGVSLIIGAFYLSCPPFAKFGNVKEQYMIACMIITACGVILRYTGGSPRWLAFSGASAINIYFFKPTGVSVIAAVGIYMLAELSFRRTTFKEFFNNVWRFALGGLIGITPLFLLYFWQGQLKRFFEFVPVLGLLYGILFIGGGYGIYQLICYCRGREQRGKRLAIYIILLLLVVLLLPWGMIGGKSKGGTFVTEMPLIKLGGGLKIICDKVYTITFAPGGYIAGSRRSTTFRSQYDNVVGYLRSFIVPIGLALVAIGWRLKTAVIKLAGKSPQADAEESDQDKTAEGIAVLLGSWWLFDMLLIWFSPRSYVEYFLPLGGSGAMLAAYAVWRSKKEPGGFLYFLGVCLLLEYVFIFLIPLGEFPYIGVRDAIASNGFWVRFAVCSGLLVGLVFLNLFMKKKQMAAGRAAVIGIVCIFMFFLWNKANFKMFSDRLERAGSKEVQSWEKAGFYVRDNSTPDDGLYVWGWLPGIYVKAQRFCPAPKPSYSDMHSDGPWRVKGYINQTVERLKEKPPKFIVDPQKYHFPYYDHPNFDLWPRWSSQRKNFFYMRYHPSQPSERTRLLTPEEMRKNEELNYEQVEGITYSLLTNPNRKGGAIEAGLAREMAQREAKRHRKMSPLREFVMMNYEPVYSEGMINIYRLKKK
ncbi:MAG: glycosyltransferase family 39 protein [Sedimentisphaerales bacterium]|nr:glycosyltransferase family 39 protein [Sedimentisphaerales bacterium]